RVKYPNPFLSFFEKHCFYIYIFYIVILADAFIQSDLHMCDLQCIHILTFTLMAHCTSGAIRRSVSCSRTLRQGIELATFCLLNDFSTSCTTVAPRLDPCTLCWTRPLHVLIRSEILGF